MNRLIRPFDGASVYRTKGIDIACKVSKTFDKEVTIALSKFRRLDYGETSFEDKLVNDDALLHYDRVIATYETVQGRIWIVAESEDGMQYTSITALFPSEY